MIKNVVEYGNIIAFHPSSYIEDCMEDSEMSVYELSEVLNLSLWKTSKLLDGEYDLDEDMALALEEEFGIMRDTWLRIQKIYNEDIVKINKQKVFWDNGFRFGGTALIINMIIFMTFSLISIFTELEIFESIAFWTGVSMVVGSIIAGIGFLVYEWRIGRYEGI